MSWLTDPKTDWQNTDHCSVSQERLLVTVCLFCFRRDGGEVEILFVCVFHNRMKEPCWDVRCGLSFHCPT